MAAVVGACPTAPDIPAQALAKLRPTADPHPTAREFQMTMSLHRSLSSTCVFVSFLAAIALAGCASSEPAGETGTGGTSGDAGTSGGGATAGTAGPGAAGTIGNGGTTG